jgi:hypothetical protein
MPTGSTQLSCSSAGRVRVQACPSAATEHPRHQRGSPDTATPGDWLVGARRYGKGTYELLQTGPGQTATLGPASLQSPHDLESLTWRRTAPLPCRTVEPSQRGESGSGIGRPTPEQRLRRRTSTCGQHPARVGNHPPCESLRQRSRFDHWVASRPNARLTSPSPRPVPGLD